MGIDAFSDDELAMIERQHAEGLSSDEIVGFFTETRLTMQARLHRDGALAASPRRGVA